MRNSTKKIKKSIADIIEIALLLAAFGVVIEILFGNAVPPWGRVMTNLMGLLGTLGENGFFGLAAVGIVVYLFRRSKVFASDQAVRAHPKR
jgi:hypothetical protein